MTLDLFAPEPPSPAPPNDDAITLAHYAERAYLEYALSVVKGRALPDFPNRTRPGAAKELPRIAEAIGVLGQRLVIGLEPV